MITNWIFLNFGSFDAQIVPSFCDRAPAWSLAFGGSELSGPSCIHPTQLPTVIGPRSRRPPVSETGPCGSCDCSPSTASLSAVHIFAGHPCEIFQVEFMGQRADAPLTARCHPVLQFGMSTSSAVRVCQMPL